MKVNAPPHVPDPAQVFSPELALSNWLTVRKEEIETALDRNLPPAETRPSVLHTAMRYACLNGGKRLRAILLLTCCRQFGGDPSRAMPAALALEAFHAYTLVHDDLPCMDDDDLRRGQPSCHIRFGEANALLAGDALLTLACQWMAECVVPLPHPPAALVLELTRAGGSVGVIGGQVEDLAAEDTPADEEALLFIHREKTARLISCACRCGAILAGACESKVERIGEFGLHLGLAFQMIDDVLDATQDTSKLGKPAGSDADNHKHTCVSLWGLERSRAEARKHTDLALRILDELGTPCERLAEITRHLLERDF